METVTRAKPHRVAERAFLLTSYNHRMVAEAVPLRHLPGELAGLAL